MLARWIGPAIDVELDCFLARVVFGIGDASAVWSGPVILALGVAGFR